MADEKIIASQIKEHFLLDKQVLRTFEGLIQATYEELKGIEFTRFEMFGEGHCVGGSTRKEIEEWGDDPDQVLQKIPKSYFEFLLMMKGIVNHLIQVVKSEDESDNSCLN